ncbi:hypothetical protein [Thermosipho atlanticus]|uniref:Uncharacterized protein n=1 Tax=Thermosipho atlanticus DSM 15807 TaxID=1123380 RepID=A0A1M5U6I3_9BACT|nr:hypothetical protein [Thermosipho atlanticus]SHH58520.1 hypothetical protein SAMN02745199_1648 [Thermosipho atlanticus DSM 15807]
MRKLLVGILVLFGLFIFANGNFIHVPGCQFDTLTLDSTITVYVHQWMDLEYEWMIDSFFDICDYENVPEDVDLLWFSLDSNADVEVSVDADWGGLDAYISGTVYVLKDGNPFMPTSPISDGDYLIGVTITNIDPNTPAGDYTVVLSITFEPTVTF